MKSSEQLDAEFEGPQKLKPKYSRIIVLIFAAIFAVFWNFVIWQVIAQPLRNNLDVFSVIMVLFSIPFVVVGVLMAFAFVYLLLGLFNPKVEIALSKGAVVLGDELDIAWQVAKGARAFRRLRISIQAREAATYQKGTDSSTDEQVVAEIPVVDSQNPKEIVFGTATIRIPADSMHSFDGKNNKILWSVVVAGEIPYWPSVYEQFEFRVKPYPPVDFAQNGCE